MQHASTMQTLSPAENLFGRLDRENIELRVGQRKLITHVSDNPNQPIYSAVLPTGYGKSSLFLCVADVLKAQGRINRVLVIVPTDTQRTQYREGISKNISEWQLNLDQNCMNVNGSHATLRANKLNKVEIFITTVQSIVADKNGYYCDLMANGKWLVFCDEYHKLNSDEDAKWGKAVESLPHTVTLGLTATPIRTDGKPTFFSNKEPDVFVSYEQAYVEEAIRGVIAHIEHYHIDVKNDDGGVDRITTDNIGKRKLSEDLRLSTKYVASLVTSAGDCLLSKNMRQNNCHQMLVFAMNVAHAKSVSETLNVIYGAGYSEWVGVGDNGRATKDNRDIIKRYKNNEFKCLVQVDMAGEGFDNPRSSVLVFLNLLRKSTVKAHQQMGRGVRRNYEVADFLDDVCDIFVSPDTELAELANDWALRTIGEITPVTPDNGDPKKTPIYEIPPFDSDLVNSEYDFSEIIKKISQGSVDRFKDLITKTASQEGKEMSGIVTDEWALNILATDRLAQLEKAEKAISSEVTWREKVDNAVKTLSGNITRLRYGSSGTKDARVDVYRMISRKWIQKTKLNSEAMLEEDFRKKHEWVSGINDELTLTREIPRWLVL